MSECPVAYIIFNRPRHTRKTFESIRAWRPTRLFIIADGPRSGHLADIENCQAARDIVAQIDWPCAVARNYADQNLGLKRRISTGLDWVFDEVDRAIVLEDDCLPHPDFFPFCEALLEKYADDDRVAVITGNNFQDGRRRGQAAYYFSKYNHCWGWATWRRAWQHYQPDLPFWPAWRDSAGWRQRVPDHMEANYWASIFDRVWRGEFDSWAYPWTASVWYRGGLTATPNVNLVTNIGFGPDGTHTVATEDEDGIPAAPLGELTHPGAVRLDHRADRYVADHTFGLLQHRLHRRLVAGARSIPGRFLAALLHRGRVD